MHKLYTFLVSALFLTGASAQIPGWLDSTFDVDGWNTPLGAISGLPQVKSEMALQPDGKIIICSNTVTSSGNSELMVSRLNADGSMDLAFARNGIFRYSIDSGYNLAVGLVLQPDGKIVTSGISNDWGTLANETFILRLNSNGALDTTFGTGGFSHWSFSPDDERVTDMKRMQDGSFVICGIISSSVSSDSSYIIKVTADGLLDSSFASNGLFKYQYNSNQTDFYAVEVLPDNSIIAGGSNYNTGGDYQNVFLIKIDSTGAVFTSFGSNGIVNKDLFSDYDEVHTIKQLSSGDILVSGYSYDDISNYNDGAFVMKMGAAGNIIYSFGNNGVAYFATPNAPNRAYDMDVQADGKIVLAGQIFNNTLFNNDFMVVRLLASGVPDTSFNNGQAYTTTDFANEYDEASAVLIQPDGKILVYGTAIFFSSTQEPMPVVARYIGGERGGLMPLSLLSFTGAAMEKSITLKWITSNELNTDYFVVEKSNDGIHFRDLARVYAYNTLLVHQYSYTDAEVKAGKTYYRLRITDKDRSATYTRIISFSTKKDDVVIFPTITHSTFTIRTARQETFSLYNASGAFVKSIRNGTNDISTLPAGVYYVKTSDSVIAITKQ